MKKRTASALALLTLSVLASAVSPARAAAPFDGSKNLTCAVTETFECKPGVKCQRGTAAHVGLPDFLRIDFRKKRILSTDEDGKGEVTKIAGVSKVEGLLLLHGTDAYHAGRIGIGDTGRMSLTLSAHQVGFIVFGACTPM